MKLLIRSGHLFDPSQNWHDQVQDLGIADGRLVRPADLGVPDRVIEAGNLVVTAAAIDPAAWVAPYEALYLQQRFGFPGPEEIGRRYSARGYGHVHHPFLSPVTALAVHRQLQRLPLLDHTVSLAVPLYDLEPWLQEDKWEETADHLARLAAHLGTFGLYLAEPALAYGLDVYRHKNRGADQILPLLGEMANRLEQPLFLPAAAVEPDTWPCLPTGTHLQRLSELPSGPAHETGSGPAGITADLGLNRPGRILAPTWQSEPAEASACTIDHGFSRYLSWRQREAADFERESDLIRPPAWLQPTDLALTSADANLALIDDWAPFLRAVLETVSLDLYLTMTRSTPARILHLPDRGHLQWGARADLACYPRPAGDSARAWADAFRLCHTLILEGGMVIEEYRRISPAPEAGPIRRQSAGDEVPPSLDFLEEGLSLRPQTLLRWEPPARDRGNA